MRQGKISSWNGKKGYGFIRPMDSGNQLFVHIKAFDDRNRHPVPGEKVSYTLSTDRQGRPCAVKAILAGGRLRERTGKAGETLSVTGASLFLLIVGVAVIRSELPPEVFAVYAMASLTTFFVYALDKTAARKGARRTPESTLHLLSLAGGWPGAMIAQQKLRHKTQKKSFRLVFWLTVVVNCGVLALVFTRAGTAMLGELFPTVG